MRLPLLLLVLLAVWLVLARAVFAPFLASATCSRERVSSALAHTVARCQV
jgi:hypothetical protein